LEYVLGDTYFEGVVGEMSVILCEEGVVVEIEVVEEEEVGVGGYEEEASCDSFIEFVCGKIFHNK
jgi:hypothetical protein